MLLCDLSLSLLVLRVLHSYVHACTCTHNTDTHTHSHTHKQQAYMPKFKNHIPHKQSWKLHRDEIKTTSYRDMNRMGLTEKEHEFCFALFLPGSIGMAWRRCRQTTWRQWEHVQKLFKSMERARCQSIHTVRSNDLLSSPTPSGFIGTWPRALSTKGQGLIQLLLWL